MLDYHLHLWPHDERDTPLNLEQLKAYCDKAQAAGVKELAVTEHLFRFRQAADLLGGFWSDDRVPAALAASMADYWDFHATADLDAYVRCAQEAKDAGLPIVIGFVVYPSFESQAVATSGIVPMPSHHEKPIGGHCVVIVGYDDTHKMFIMRNSWGTGWGQKGYFMMPYAYLTNPRLSSDFWMASKIE